MLGISIYPIYHSDKFPLGLINIDCVFITGVSAYSEYTFTTSKPPYDGYCNVSPNNGTSLETTFKVSCHEWKSPVGSLNYRVLLRAQANENHLLSYGLVPEADILLSAGDESNHHMVNITVEIIDLYEASTSFPLHVQVQPCRNLPGQS